MKNENLCEKQPSRVKKPLIIALVVLLLLVAGWHLILPILGITLAITAGLWVFAVISIVLLIAGTLLLFIFSSAGVIAISAAGFLWVLFAIFTFPILFPVLIPLLILMFFIGYICKRPAKSR